LVRLDVRPDRDAAFPQRSRHARGVAFDDVKVDHEAGRVEALRQGWSGDLGFDVHSDLSGAARQAHNRRSHIVVMETPVAMDPAQPAAATLSGRLRASAAPRSKTASWPL